LGIGNSALASILGSSTAIPTIAPIIGACTLVYTIDASILVANNSMFFLYASSGIHIDNTLAIVTSPQPSLVIIVNSTRSLAIILHMDGELALPKGIKIHGNY